MVSTLRTFFFLSGSGSETPSGVIETGDFVIHLGTRQAKVRSQQLELSDEEFELLVFLVGHPTGVITPQTRLSTRWGRNPVHQAEVLRVLTQLRKKLESVGCSNCVRTEPWIVYRFDPRNREVH